MMARFSSPFCLTADGVLESASLAKSFALETSLIAPVVFLDVSRSYRPSPGSFENVYDDRLVAKDASKARPSPPASVPPSVPPRPSRLSIVAHAGEKLSALQPPTANM
ncbi:hypothetical protein CIHG_04897 [Coccidioides immitis H538.4]|uniref:Uncharacterized protein n=2 Tax=Coccidioides immitis TaxID=5501 RepID=A0A0J8QPL0_COCIT|nr:hypothetical protein CISG_04530 [Coccidioides immitis RMSCC 3703]KMU86957.1 hypothetical protein CIHG_04897 [Coccidioides immitis H538.4]TPX22906.1 hypothetical protein DIZ76_014787 [Coccidioides immitis]